MKYLPLIIASPFIAIFIILIYQYYKRRYRWWTTGRLFKTMAKKYKHNPVAKKQLEEMLEMYKQASKEETVFPTEDDLRF